MRLLCPWGWSHAFPASLSRCGPLHRLTSERGALLSSVSSCFTQDHACRFSGLSVGVRSVLAAPPVFSEKAGWGGGTFSMTCLLGFPGEGMGALSFCERFEHTFGFFNRYGGSGFPEFSCYRWLVVFSEWDLFIPWKSCWVGYFLGNVGRDASLVEQYFVFSLFFSSVMTRTGWSSSPG